MGSSLSIFVVFFLFHFFLLHDKKAAKFVVLRRNFKVSKINVARWSIDLILEDASDRRLSLANIR